MNWKAFLCAFLLPVVVSAQTPPIVTLPGEDRIVPLKKGQEAPFDGQLFDPGTSLRWAFWLQQYKLRHDLDVKYAQETCRVNLDYQQRLLTIEKERARAVEKDLRERILRSEKARLASEEAGRNPSWFQSRDFGIVVGVVSTLGLVGLTLWTSDRLQK